MDPAPQESPTDEGGSDEEQPFIPAEARPAVVEGLARTAWQVAEALRSFDAPAQ
ncbi:hypothetical protein [Frankia sp. EAN1pec]|uniref:hypothetical protein n=1 Tax=Parafrankia sp. (strain EAN1pec) TaxID=298653 RepID=UPI0012F92F94